MEPKFYTLSKIEGEYAYLSERDGNGEVFIALALLPQGADVGSVLRFEMFTYTLEQ